MLVKRAALLLTLLCLLIQQNPNHQHQFQLIKSRDPIENNPEAPVAQAIAQNLVPPTPTTEYPVRPSSIN